MTKIPLRVSYSGDHIDGTEPRCDETELLDILGELKTDFLTYVGKWSE
jgi:hypothetical protein